MYAAMLLHQAHVLSSVRGTLNNACMCMPTLPVQAAAVGDGCEGGAHSR